MAMSVRECSPPSTRRARSSVSRPAASPPELREAVQGESLGGHGMAAMVLRLAAPADLAVGSPGRGALGLDRPGHPDRGPDDGRHQRTDPHDAHDDRAAVAADELPEPVAGRGRVSEDRLVVEEPQHIGGEAVGRLGSAIGMILQAPHHDPVELPADQPGQLGRFGLTLRRDRSQRSARVAQPRTRPRRLLLPDEPEELLHRWPVASAHGPAACCRSATRRATPAGRRDSRDPSGPAPDSRPRPGRSPGGNPSRA